MSRKNSNAGQLNRVAQSKRSEKRQQNKRAYDFRNSDNAQRVLGPGSRNLIQNPSRAELRTEYEFEAA